jgi:hypothetical protein
MGSSYDETREAHTNPTIVAAILGLVGTVTAALIPGLLARRASVRNDAYDKVTGTITDPEREQVVGRTFQCSGVVTGLQSNLSLWLAVEVGGLAWPKEGRVSVDKDNKWSVTMFEDGPNDVFDVSLFVADARVDKRIMKWLDRGRQTGTYPSMMGIPGGRRLTRVDGLRLKRAPS